MRSILIISYLLIALHSIAQPSIKGKVLDKTTNEPLLGATVRWLTVPTSGVQTSVTGEFEIRQLNQEKNLLVSFVGYRDDTISVEQNSVLSLYLISDDTVLDEVKVKGQSSVIDKINPIQTEIITTKTLAKAACCNLSESFETNASVSVNYADAVTGAKQIQLLGLSGNYVLTSIENIPSIRGLASTFGFNYIPGTWIQSIDLGKGAGSVVNGFESMTGAINVELQKPDISEKLYLNIYANHLGRTELNINSAHKLSKKWSVGVLSHASTLKNSVDSNTDGFIDLPIYSQLNVLNRWKYSGEKLMAQFGFRYLYDDRTGGQTGFKSHELTPKLYGFTNTTNRMEFFSKTAKLFPETPYRGLGLILNGVWHNSISSFGFMPYNGSQRTLYANLIYQDILSSTQHTVKMGASMLIDAYDELYDTNHLKRTENVPGVFAEYTYNRLDKTILVIGNRVDFHSLFGIQYSPRIHFKQDLGANFTWRLSAGRGSRTPNRLAEFYGNLVSNRQVVFLSELAPEIAYNLGTSLTYSFGKTSVIVDVYHTEFQQKLIGDTEQHGYLYFYSSDERAYSTTLQAEFSYQPTDRWEFKLAYRFLDTRQTMGKPKDISIILPLMFVNKERALANIAYALPYDKWKTDLTIQWNGKRRIMPSHQNYYTDIQSFAPSFINVNAQITRTFIKWDTYLGGENLTNFKQQNPIINPQNPFSENFDAGMAWGPVVGRIIYLGMRYKIRN